MQVMPSLQKVVIKPFPRVAHPIFQVILDAFDIPDYISQIVECILAEKKEMVKLFLKLFTSAHKVVHPAQVLPFALNVLITFSY